MTALLIALPIAILIALRVRSFAAEIQRQVHDDRRSA